MMLEKALAKMEVNHLKEVSTLEKLLESQKKESETMKTDIEEIKRR